VSSIEAAVFGQGIALGWKHLVHDNVKAGRLVCAWQETHRSGEAIHIVMPAQRPPKRGAELFRDWLMEQDADAPVFAEPRREV